MVPPSYDIREARIPMADGALDAALTVPDAAKGAVLFAHGSGSSRFSPRNRLVAQVLNEGGLATVLLDLLTGAEQEVDRRTRELRFDIDRLTLRMTAALDWAAAETRLRGLRLGLFGASTGTAAALGAAAERPALVSAIVSRGGRPDLAAERLAEVEAPSLLIVGGLDTPVIEMNRRAAALLRAPSDVVVVPGATHLFEEPGTLEEVAERARDWFLRHLAP